MNVLLANREIEEIQSSSGFSYILNDSTKVSNTDYKVLLRQRDGIFLKTMKMLYNGKVQFYYMSDDLRSFSAMMYELNLDKLMAVVASLFANILQVKNNGFLSCGNIDVSFEHIFVDPSSYRTCLVYLPATCGFFEDGLQMENELRSSLVKLIPVLPAVDQDRAVGLISDLSNGMLGLEELVVRYAGAMNTSTEVLSKDSGMGSLYNREPEPPKPKSMRLVSMNYPERIQIDITKQEFIIGKKRDSVDFALDISNLISRIHCKVIRTEEGFSIMDLNSANHTYINRFRLLPDISYPLKNGDVVGMAHNDFQVIIE